MNKCLIIIVLFVFVSCSSDLDMYKIPKNRNLGYLYDSLQYENEHWMDCGIHDTTNDEAHRMYCCLRSFIPYCHLVYAEKDIKDVYINEGKPQYIRQDTLHYGFVEDIRGEWIFPFEEFYNSEGYGPDSCQAVYRIQKILNHPFCIVQTSIWEDSARYLRLNSLVLERSNQVFWGFKAQNGFHWPE